MLLLGAKKCALYLVAAVAIAKLAEGRRHGDHDRLTPLERRTDAPLFPGEDNYISCDGSLLGYDGPTSRRYVGHPVIIQWPEDSYPGGWPARYYADTRREHSMSQDAYNIQRRLYMCIRKVDMQCIRKFDTDNVKYETSFNNMRHMGFDVFSPEDAEKPFWGSWPPGPSDTWDRRLQGKLYGFLSSQLENEVCYNKCRCIRSTRRVFNEEYPKLPANLVNSQRVIEWSFDPPSSLAFSLPAILRDRLPDDRIFVQWGLDVAKVGNKLYPAQEAEISLGTGNPLVTAWAFTGNKNNQPLCKATKVPELFHRVLQARNAPFSPNSATELCVHRYFGGHRDGNAGGVCLRQPDGSRALEFPEYLRSPYLALESEYRRDRDPGTPLPADVFLGRLVQTFCQHACSCAGQKSELEPKPEALTQQQQPTLSGMLKWFAAKWLQDKNKGQDQKTPESGTAQSGGGEVPMDCAGSCVDYSQCSTGCSCKAYQTADPKGLDPFEFSATCVSTALLGVLTGPIRKGRPHPRDVTACPCNASYVSGACCQSSGGLVWEAPEMKLGVLRAV